MTKTKPKNDYISSIDLHNTNTIELKNDIKNYFLTTWELYESLFEILNDPMAMYEQPNPLRHPLIFYYGHTATFFINKFAYAKIIKGRVDEQLENMFAIGVDEMAWDDMNDNHYTWPKVQEVQEYRNKVKQIVLEAIESTEIQMPINDKSDIWIILMGIEHEKIHLETSSVLIRELDLKYVKSHKKFDASVLLSEEYPSNELVQVKGGSVSLGKTPTTPKYYGWDNEYGTQENSLVDFEASKYLVSNGEFLQFMKDDGYENNAFWDSEGKAWKESLGEKIPHFWILRQNAYYLRLLNEEIPLPLNLPAEVNHYEAEAFCKYKSQKDGIEIRLPSEDEYMRLGEHTNAYAQPANINLASTAPVAVDTFAFGDFYDVMGNVWQWTNTPTYPFVGFEPHFAYDDFSLPTFDDKHFLMKGGSFISTGNEAIMSSRYAFRKYFFQHCGFRYVHSTNDYETTKNNNTYESDVIVEEYCEFHYGDTYFGVDNFMEKSARLITGFAKKYNVHTGKALDLGCSVGRASFELARTFDEVEGIDFSANFINAAIKFLNNEKLSFHLKQEGELKTNKQVTLASLGLDNLKGKLAFYQGDACNMKPHFTGYDVIMCSNLIDRLYDPRVFLDSIQARLNQNGLLVISSPYTWLEAFTPKEKWLGGYKDKQDEISTLGTLEKELTNFKLLETHDVEFVIRETKRKFQHSVSQMSVWQKLS